METSTQQTAPTENSTTVVPPVSDVSTQNTQASAQAEVTQTTEVVSSLSSEVEIKPVEKAAESEKSETEVPTPKRPDFNPMINAYLKGTLEDADYEAIEQAGLTKEQFTMMAEGIKATQQKNDAELHSWVGGAEKYAELRTFAADNLTADEIQMYNGALATGNMKAAKIMVLGLQTMYEQQNGKKPAMRIEADGTGASKEAYANRDNLIKDLNNPKYKSDPAFKAEVDAKRRRSGF